MSEAATEGGGGGGEGLCPSRDKSETRGGNPQEGGERMTLTESLPQLGVSALRATTLEILYLPNNFRTLETDVEYMICNPFVIKIIQTWYN